MSLTVDPVLHRLCVRGWQDRKRARGYCVICGKERGPDGTKLHCRKHAEIVNATPRPPRRGTLMLPAVLAFLICCTFWVLVELLGD